MRKLSFTFVVVVAAVCLTAAPSAFAGHTWGNYHWSQAHQTEEAHAGVEVRLADSLTNTSVSPWKTLFSTQGADGDRPVVQAWSGLDLTQPSTFFTNDVRDVLDTPSQTGKNVTSQKRCKPYTGTVEVCNARYGKNGWLGLAQIWTSGGHIVQATAKMNDSYYDNTRLFPASDQVARQHVLCQEVGHAFGLGHQDESGTDYETCMDYDDHHSNAQPNQHDNHTVNAIYRSHTDGGSTTATSTKTNPGQVKRLSKDLYVEDKGNGEKVFTFVTWVDERAARSAPNDRAPQ